MRTSCVRPGCGGPVAAAVLMDRDQQIVVLHAPHFAEPGAIALCSKHVDRVTTPTGWEIRDLRVVLEAVAEPPAAPPVSALPDGPALVAATVTLMNTKRRAAVVVPDESLLVDDGATPMLGRAFRAASPGELRRPGESRGFAWLERGLEAELGAALGE